jgi:ketosteroid isomerase-like protein
VSNHDFDSAVESYQQALHAFLKGDAGPVSEHFSRRDDVTLANPLGPPRLGRAAVEKAIVEAASHFEDGHMDFEEISRVATSDLGYVVWIERGEVRLVGSAAMAPSSLRVTMIFRREGDTWKVAHRHADPITSDRPVSVVLEA